MPHLALPFLKTFLIAAALVAASLWLLILLLDPYGVSPIRLPIQRPIMDINQRYMYPQIVRSRRYDSLVIGTSTSRLLDPEALNVAFGGRFANLAMNAATAWEQSELLKLALRHQSAPKTVIIGLDQMWCVDEQNLQKITFRGFPEWMYDDNPWNDLPGVFNSKALEITGRLAAYHLGWMKERIRRDGYEVFTPPEQTYDLARARAHIWRGYAGQSITPVEPPVILAAQTSAALQFPALQWLDDILTRIPHSSQRILAAMPLHIAAQPMPGSAEAARITVCKERIAAIARKHDLRFADFSIGSAITRDDANYWDPLHYRLPVAKRIIDGLQTAVQSGQDSPEGLYKVLN